MTVQAIMFLIAQWDVLSPATHLIATMVQNLKSTMSVIQLIQIVIKSTCDSKCEKMTDCDSKCD